MSVVFKRCDLFNETYKKHAGEIKDQLEKFLSFKAQNPLMPFNKKDYPFKGNGVLHGIGHAHLTFNISVFYTLTGRDPRVIQLIGIFTHDESGIGNPAKPNLQRSLKSRIDTQKFV